MRTVNDTDYVECLRTQAYVEHYYRWKEKILPIMDTIAKDFETMSVEEIREKYRMTPREIAVMVQVGYLTPEEVERFQLQRFARMVII